MQQIHSKRSAGKNEAAWLIKSYAPVESNSVIDVEYFDLDGNLNSRRLHKVVARCFEHELDHLDGICFITKVSKLKLDMAMRKRLKK